MSQTLALPDQGRLLEVLLYNPETGHAYWRTSGKGKRQNQQAGCQRHDGYRVIAIDGVQYLFHRIAWKIMTGTNPPDLVDHHDGNPSNNKWINLRSATEAQNHHNSRQRSNNTSGIKGVCWDEARQKWVARVRTPGVRHNLGRFDSIEKAQIAIQSFRNRAHGNFSNHG